MLGLHEARLLRLHESGLLRLDEAGLLGREERRWLLEKARLLLGLLLQVVGAPRRLHAHRSLHAAERWLSAELLLRCRASEG